MCLCHKQYNLVPIKRRWCPAAGKVTVGLASHWPCVTDISGLPTFGLSSLVEYGPFTLPYSDDIYNKDNITSSVEASAWCLHRVGQLKQCRFIPGKWLSWKLLCACTNTGTMAWIHSFWNVSIISRSMSANYTEDILAQNYNNKVKRDTGTLTVVKNCS